MGEIDKARIAEALSILRRGERDWDSLNSEERHGTVHTARYELEQAINESRM